MTGKIRVSVSHMRQDADQIQSQIQRIRQEVSALQTAMDKLATCWEGSAWETFQGQVNGSIQYMMSVQEWLQSYLGTTEEAASGYRNCERTVSERITSLRI